MASTFSVPLVQRGHLLFMAHGVSCLRLKLPHCNVCLQELATYRLLHSLSEFCKYATRIISTPSNFLEAYSRRRGSEYSSELYKKPNQAAKLYVFGS